MRWRSVGPIPENDDKSVEDVEAVAYVADEAVSGELQHHLDGEQDREQQVAVFEHLCQYQRLYTANQPQLSYPPHSCYQRLHLKCFYL